MRNMYKLLQDLRVTDQHVFVAVSCCSIFGAICTLMVVYMCSLCTIQILHVKYDSLHRQHNHVQKF